MSDSTDDLTPAEPEAAAGERPEAPPIENRFLFVDVAAMRAKQLRRGALVRYSVENWDPQRTPLYKPERVAMEEVRRCLVPYETPPLTKPEPR